MRLNRDPKLAFLRELPLFADCSLDELQRVAAVADSISLPAGKRLTIEGTSGQEFVILESGHAAVYKQGHEVAHLGSSDFLGEISLLTGRPRSATVVTSSPVQALVVARPRFFGLTDHLPGVRDHLDAVIPLREAS